MTQTEGPGFVDPEPADVADAKQKTLQEVVADVTVHHSGAELDVVRTALEEGLAAEGFDPQPHKWVDDTSSEIASGRHVVTDRTLGAGTGPSDGPGTGADDEDDVPDEAQTPGGN